MPNIFPDKACYCFPLTSAVNVCLVLAVLLRVAGVTCESVQQMEEFDSLGFQAAVSMGPISTCQSPLVVCMLQVSLTKLSRSEIIPVFSSRLSTNLVSQQKIRRGKIPLRLFQSKGLDSSVASDEHPRRVWPCGCPG